MYYWKSLSNFLILEQNSERKKERNTKKKAKRELSYCTSNLIEYKATHPCELELLKNLPIILQHSLLYNQLLQKQKGEGPHSNDPTSDSNKKW